MRVSTPNARKSLPATTNRRLEAAVLVVVSVIAVACASGPQWAQYVGLGLLIVALFASTWRSWREIDRLTKAHAEAIRALRQQAKEAAHAHHEELMETIARFAMRSEAHREQLAAITAELEQVSAELEAAQVAKIELSTQLDASRLETAEATERVAELEKKVASLTEQLEDLAAQIPDAELLQLPPRRVEDEEPTQELRQA